MEASPLKLQVLVFSPATLYNLVKKAESEGYTHADPTIHPVCRRPRHRGLPADQGGEPDRPAPDGGPATRHQHGRGVARAAPGVRTHAPHPVRAGPGAASRRRAAGRRHGAGRRRAAPHPRLLHRFSRPLFPHPLHPRRHQAACRPLAAAPAFPRDDHDPSVLGPFVKINIFSHR